MWNRVGKELAALASGAAGDGSRILLIRAGKETSIGPEQDAIEKTLRGALGRAEIVVATLPNRKRTPDQIAANMPDLPVALEAGWLSEEAQKHAPLALIVSLAGEPMAAPPTSAKWPPVVCFAPAAQEPLSGLIQSGVVLGAVVQRHDNPKKGEDDWFSLRYAVVRKDNIAAW